MNHDDLRAMVALTARLASGEKALAPLTPTEWDTTAQVIYQRGAWPRDLLGADAPDLLAAIAGVGKRLAVERLTALLLRMDHVDRRLYDWESQEIVVVPRKADGYPLAFWRYLKASSPPLLWVRGDRKLLSRQGIAIVGSRDAEYEALRRASNLGAAVAAAGFVTVSGGARGIDERAVEGALMAGGSAVVILPDSLAVQSKKIQFQRFLDTRALTLISPYSPDAGYQTGTAMGRNRLIYCLSSAAFVVRSSRHAGGTFAGAQQALKEPWTRMWIEYSNDPATGNYVLGQHEHASWLPLDDLGPVWDSMRVPAMSGVHSIAEESADWVPFE